MASITVKSVEVILLLVEDLEASRHFYEGILGLERKFEDRGRTVYVVGGTRIMLHPVDQPPGDPLADEFNADPLKRGLGTALFLEVEDVQSAVECLRAQSVPITTEPRDRPWGLREVGLRDPSGYSIYLVQSLGANTLPLPPDLPPGDPGADALLAGDWKVRLKP